MESVWNPYGTLPDHKSLRNGCYMSPKTRTALIPFLFVWLWSTGFIGARFGLPYIEPFHFISIRFGIVIVLFAIMIYIAKALWVPLREIGLQMLVGFLLHGLYLGGVFYAISRGFPAGLSAIIVGVQPILTITVNRVFFGTLVSQKQAIGVILGFVGLLAVILGSAEIDGSDVGTIGLTACIVALFGIAASTIIQKRYCADIPLLAGSFWQYVGAFITVLPATLLLETHWVEHTWQLYAAIIWAIVALSIVAVLLLMYMIREGEVAKVTSYFYLVPPAAVIQAWWLFGETLSLVSIFGCLVVMLGVALVVRN